MAELEEILEAVRKAVEQLSEVRPMRRGSLGERFTKCGKPNCACATDDAARHGPYHALTRVVKGKTRSRRLSAQEAARVQEQVEEGRRFRDQVEACWEACEQWADAELEGAGTDTAEAVKKGGSSRSSRRRSQRKSRS